MSALSLATDGYLHGPLAMATDGYVVLEQVSTSLGPSAPIIGAPRAHGGFSPTMVMPTGAEVPLDRKRVSRIVAASIGVALDRKGLPGRLAATLALVLDDEVD
jgi:hypothetical protein